jgi:4-amino-4-deoxy-L-arabinose transferase-like glycosyltransferase
MRAVLQLIVWTGLARLALAGVLGLSVDESYTVAISRHLDLSYFDHPPLHVWLVAAVARLCGSEQPLLLRLPDIALFAGSTWLIYRLTALLCGERAGQWAALSFNLAPLFTFNSAIGVVPDGPLIFFSLLAIECFATAVLTDAAPPRARALLLACGAALGLALLSKYTALFVLLGLGVYLASCHPRLLARADPWLAVLTAALLFTPVLAWNHAHHWASFTFQAGRARWLDFSLARAAADFAAQCLYLLPWTAAAALAALLRALRRGPHHERSWLLACLAAAPIAAFSLAAAWTEVLPHWAAVGWLFTLPLLGERLAALEPERTRLLQRITTGSAVLLVALALLLVSQASTGWVERVFPAFAANDPTLDVLDWRALAPPVAHLRRERPTLVIATVSWIDAGKASYALGGGVPVLCLSQDPREFAFSAAPRDFLGREALIVAPASRPDWLRRAAPYFSRIEPGADVVLTRAGAPALTLHTAWGISLRAAPPLPPTY